LRTKLLISGSRAVRCWSLSFCKVVIVNDLTVGPRWLAPVLELTLLIPLSIATAWTQRHARKASTDEQWNFVGRQRLMVRRATRTPGFMVCIELLHASWKAKSVTVSVSNKRLRKAGVSREIKRRVLRDLEAAGLITIERRRGCSPRVTLVVL
jgi:hypothetical protein